MGTFSVRSLRADIQNVSMRNNRAFRPSLVRFMACYLCTCVALYLYFRYYLTNERDYGTPLPAAVTHDSMFRPLESFSSGKVAVSANDLFERLYKHKVKKRPGTTDDFSWYKPEDDVMTRLEQSDSDRLQSDSSNKPHSHSSDKLYSGFRNKPHFDSLDEKASEKGGSLSSSVINFTFANSINSIDQNGDFDRIQNANNLQLRSGNSTSKKTNISIAAPSRDDNNFDLNMVQIISNPQIIHNSTMISRKFQDFRREWFRQRRARVDWQSLMKPCIDNMAWGLVKNHWGKINRSSAIASEVVSWNIKPAGEFSKIFIQSKTSDNRTKLIGGDTWRVYARGPSNVAATMFDHHNGTYEALFLLTEPGVYQLKIYLDYSLCDGFRDPPRDWFIKGNAQGKYQKDGLLGTLDDYLKQPFKNGNPLIITVPEAQLNASFIGMFMIKKRRSRPSCTKSGSCCPLVFIRRY